MAHFIKLFFLTIGITISQTELDYKYTSTPQQKSQSIHFKYSSAKKIHSTSKRKLYSDNNGILKLQPIGDEGWGGYTTSGEQG